MKRVFFQVEDYTTTLGGSKAFQHTINCYQHQTDKEMEAGSVELCQTFTCCNYLNV